MPFEYKRPKLKDKLYGEMFWEDFDEDENYWFAPMETGAGERFDLLIVANSSADFLAVQATHSTYRLITERLDAICAAMIDDILKDSGLLKKKRQRHSAGKAFEKSLRLFALKILGDLSSEVQFVERVGEHDESNEFYYALLDENCQIVETGIDKM